MGNNPFQGPIGTRWPEAEAEFNLPPEGVHISDAPDSSADPRPQPTGETALDASNRRYFESGYAAGKRDAMEPKGEIQRTLPSNGVEDQTDPDSNWSKGWSCDGLGSGEHYMVSVKTNSDMVQYVERCSNCGWIDGMSLNWWAQNAIKMQLSARAQRIAVAAEAEPFAFVQSSNEELPLEEVLIQALAAANLEGVQQSLNASLGKRMTSISKALRAEVERYIRLELEKAASRALTFLVENTPRSWTSVEGYGRELRKAIEEKP